MRYLRSPNQKPHLQAACTFGYQRFSDVEASRYSIVPSFVYRLPNHVDLLAQFEYEDYRQGLEEAIGFRDQATMWIGLAYDFEMRLNDSFGDRADVLNMEHRHIP